MKKEKIYRVTSFRLSDQEKKNLALLVAWHDNNKSAVVRELINSAAAALRGKE